MGNKTVVVIVTYFDVTFALKKHIFNMKHEVYWRFPYATVPLGK